MQKLGSPYIEFDEENVAIIYIDIVCVVTFNVDDRTLTKEVPFTLYFESYIGYYGKTEVGVNSNNNVFMPEACGVDGDLPSETA